MPRTKHSAPSRERRRKYLKSAKGFYGGRSKLYKTAKEAVHHSMLYAYRDRRRKKRDFRRLWIARINAAARVHGLSYNKFISGLKRAEVDIDRKMLAEMAVNDKEAFRNLAEKVKSVVPAAPAAG
jgi:large subunit ribosomal protein L20